MVLKSRVALQILVGDGRRIFEDEDIHLSMELCSGGCLTDRVKAAPWLEEGDGPEPPKLA